MNYKLKLLFYYIKYKFFMNFKNRETLAKYQTKKLKKHLDFITRNSKFYENFKNKELSEFPIIDKKIMMNNFNEMNTVGVEKEKAFEIAFNSEKSRNFKERYKNITVGLSSGTSGNRGIFLASNDEQAKWSGIILAKLLPKFILCKQKIALFLRSDSELYNSVSSKVIIFKFFDLSKDTYLNIESLNDFKPDVLIAPASMLKILAASIDKLHIRPIKIFSCAEVLTDDDKIFLKDKFKLEINNIYQATEGFLGYSKDGNFVINEDVIYVEKEYIDKERGRFIPIITDFERKSQPIIRYRLNDIWLEDNKVEDIDFKNTQNSSFQKSSSQKSYSKKPSSQKFYSPFLRLKNIEGREDDIFIFCNRAKEKTLVFPDFIRRTLMMSSSNIYEYSVSQISANELEISFVIDDNISNFDTNLSPDIIDEIDEIDEINKTSETSEINKIKTNILLNFKQLFNDYNISFEDITIRFSDYKWKEKLAKNKRISRKF